MRNEYDKFVQTIEQIKNIIDKLNIKYWFEHGSCLGLFRDGKFLEDYDLDIGVIDTRHAGAILNEITKNFKLYSKYWRLEEGGHAGRIRYIRIDLDCRIDFLFYFRDNKSYYSIRNEDEEYYYIKRVPYEYLDELSKVDYRNKDYPVPKYTGSYLKYIYGDDWKIPNPRGKSIYKIEKIKK